MRRFTHFAAVALMTSSAFGQAYDVIDLGPVVPHAINNRGHVAGVNERNHAFLWADGEIADFGTLGGLQSAGFALNEFDVVVGRSDDPAMRPIAAIFHDHLEGLGTLGGNEACALAINEAGVIVGESRISPDDTIVHAFRYVDGEMVDLGTLGGAEAAAFGINSDGVIVGWSSNAAGHRRAFLVGSAESASMIDLGSLGGAESAAFDINDHGRIVGMAQDAQGRYQAFMRTGEINHFIGSGNLATSAALAINERDQIVGYMRAAVGSTFATVAARFEPTGPRDLNEFIACDSGWVLEAAHDINDHGQIVGVGQFGGERRGFLLQLRSLILTETPSDAAGANETFVVSNATPGKSSYLLWSERAGKTPLERFAFGLEVDLRFPMVIGRGLADEHGLARIDAVIPVPESVTWTMYLQAVEPASARPSNVITKVQSF